MNPANSLFSFSSAPCRSQRIRSPLKSRNTITTRTNNLHRLVPNFLRSYSPISIRAGRRPSIFVRVRNSRHAIRGSRQKDPHCAMAYWGQAMTSITNSGIAPAKQTLPKRRTSRQSSFPQSPTAANAITSRRFRFSTLTLINSTTISAPTLTPKRWKECTSAIPTTAKPPSFTRSHFSPQPRARSQSNQRQSRRRHPQQALRRATKSSASPLHHPQLRHPAMASLALPAARKYARSRRLPSRRAHASHIFARLGLCRTTLTPTSRPSASPIAWLRIIT